MKYECEKCGREFKKNDHLKSHMTKKYPCVKQIYE